MCSKVHFTDMVYPGTVQVPSGGGGGGAAPAAGGAAPAAAAEAKEEEKKEEKVRSRLVFSTLYLTSFVTRIGRVR
jgi:ribosomal protein L12E/L44/L45/RPP1/RPP2